MTHDNVELVRQLLDAFSRGDGDTVRQLWAPEGEWRPAYAGGGLVEGKVYRGLDEVVEFVTGQAETWESIVATPLDIRSVGDRVLAEVHLEAVGRVSGLAVDRTTWNVFEVRDGRVEAGRVYITREEALAAVGLRDNVATVRAWVRACNEGDADAAVALCDPSFEMTESSALPGAATTSGLDRLRRYFAGWNRNWSEWDWQEEELQDIPPDKVLLVANLRLKGLRSGLWVERRWVYLFTVRRGKLLRQDGFEGKAEALEAARRAADV